MVLGKWFGSQKDDSSEPARPSSEAVRFVKTFLKESEKARLDSLQPSKFESGRTILASSPELQIEILHVGFERSEKLDREIWAQSDPKDGLYESREALGLLLKQLIKRHLPFSEGDVLAFLRKLVLQKFGFLGVPAHGVLSQVERRVAEHGLTDRLRDLLKAVQANESIDFSDAEDRRLAARIDVLLGKRPKSGVEPGMAWSDQALSDLHHLSEPERAAWDRLIDYAGSAKSSKPSAKWLREAKGLLDAVGIESFLEHLLRWLDLLSKYQPEDFQRNRYAVDRNGDILKGLIWCSSLVEDLNCTRGLGRTAEVCFQKIRFYGPRWSKVGNACLQALASMSILEAVAELSRLKVRNKYLSVQKILNNALERAAKKQGLTAEELEEMSVPAYGLGPDGVRREKLGSFTAELRIRGASGTELGWLKDDGRAQKSVPKEIRTEFADELKELKQAAKDIQRMLPAGRQRLERFYLEPREWDFTTWKERYLDHPLMGHISRRLIWCFEDPDRKAQGIGLEGNIVDVGGAPLSWLAGETRVQLWHPIGVAPEEVLAWREFLSSRELTQPFKQAHREIYVVTDAEIETGTYSNRFASHIIRQRPFNALCRERGWRHGVEGAWDSANTSFRPLSRWELTAEFWIESVQDSHDDQAIYVYLATDQVRFCRSDGDPVPLIEVPALVFSEIMRDVDLFVGVTSVGNDPEWGDRGEQPWGNYWQSFSFGELSATAATRRDVLENLLPKLKIADRCAIEDRFLVVRGDLRTYKIHLGSGNILMKPNDQYLCIVPDSSKSGKESEVILPFEGDRTLSLVLSKAFLLAGDTKIKDQTIVSQIRSG